MSETDGVWLTKADIARVRGITIASAYRLIRRQGWRRQPGNDGKIRVLVPPDWANGHRMGESAVPSAVPSAGPLTEPSDATSDIPSDGADLVRLIEAANVRADEANRRADAAMTLADRTLAQLADATARSQADIDALRNALSRWEERAARGDALIANLEADLRTRDAEIAEHRAAADHARARADAMRQLAARQEGVDATEAIRQAEAMVDSLREAHAGEVDALKAERHRLATQIDGFATRADQAEARTDSLRARVDVLQRERDAARGEAKQAAEELRQAEGERRARGRWARLMAAWRGE